MSTQEKEQKDLKLLMNIARANYSMKLSIYSIIKNEEKMIRTMLESVKGADEIVVCIDDTTTDNSEAIAREYTDKVFKFKWDDDFAKAKNEAASHCTGDWLMSMDGDLRLEEDGIAKIRTLIENTRYDLLNIELESLSHPGSVHLRGKIYKRESGLQYRGRAHEDFPRAGNTHESGVLPKIYYGYSENHAKDPNRYIRILGKQVKENPESARPRFYLAREYFYKKEYNVAISHLEQYLKLPTNQNERVEALFIMAQCYWFSKQGEKARKFCGEAILLNPDHAPALRFMASMCAEPWKSKWAYIAKNATNKDVMFRK
jgi:glycosyltransferase involved in cell wall biosynthesis